MKKLQRIYTISFGFGLIGEKPEVHTLFESRSDKDAIQIKKFHIIYMCNNASLGNSQMPRCLSHADSHKEALFLKVAITKIF